MFLAGATSNLTSPKPRSRVSRVAHLASKVDPERVAAGVLLGRFLVVVLRGRLGF